MGIPLSSSCPGEMPQHIFLTISPFLKKNKRGDGEEEEYFSPVLS
jgi:hypothetical protein